MGKNKAVQAATAPATNGSAALKHAHVAKTNGASKVAKKSKKAITPPSETSSESGSESEDESEKSSSESGSDSSQSEVEVKNVKVNGAAKVANGVQADDSSSDSSSESSESESEAIAAAKKKAGDAIVHHESNSEEETSDSDDDDVAAGVTPSAVVVNGNKTASSSDSASDSDSEVSSNNSDSEDENDEEEKAKEVIVPSTSGKKRKNEEEDVPAAKKTKKAKEADVTTTNVPDASGRLPSSTLFLGNLPFEVDEEWLHSEFADLEGIVGCRIVTDRESGRSKGFGYVEFGNVAQGTQAYVAKNGFSINGRTINVDYSEPRPKPANNRQDRVNDRAEHFGDSANAPSDTVFIGNLPFAATAELVQEAFEQYGNITRVALPTHEGGETIKGFGYVGFTSIDEATAAKDAMNGADMMGRAIRTDFAPARQNDDARGRGGRGGRGGGGSFGGRGGRGGRGDRGGGSSFGGRGRGGRGGFVDRGGRGGRGGRGDRGGRGGFGSTNRGGMGDFSGKKIAF